MLHEGLVTDFNNIRSTESYVIGAVINEAENYIHFLEDQKAKYDAIAEHLNLLSESKLTETKAEILASLDKFFV